MYLFITKVMFFFVKPILETHIYLTKINREIQLSGYQTCIPL